MLGPMDAVTAAVPSAQLTSFVDDVSAAAQGTSQEVAAAIWEVGEQLAQEVGTIGCQIAEAKTAVAASSKKLAARVGRMLGVACPSEAAVFLGGGLCSRQQEERLGDKGNPTEASPGRPRPRPQSSGPARRRRQTC